MTKKDRKICDQNIRPIIFFLRFFGVFEWKIKNKTLFTHAIFICISTKLSQRKIRNHGKLTILFYKFTQHKLFYEV